MKPPADNRISKDFYKEVAKELEAVAELVRTHPELNHHAAERLAIIAGDIRRDAGLPKAKATPRNKKK